MMALIARFLPWPLPPTRDQAEALAPARPTLLAETTEATKPECQRYGSVVGCIDTLEPGCCDYCLSVVA